MIHLEIVKESLVNSGINKKSKWTINNSAKYFIIRLITEKYDELCSKIQIKFDFNEVI